MFTLKLTQWLLD